MNRKEYLELVSDWNNFLKEEKNYSNEKLIIESILLNENKLKSLAKKLKTTTAVVSIALGLLLSNQANAQQQNYTTDVQQSQSKYSTVKKDDVKRVYGVFKKMQKV